MTKTKFLVLIASVLLVLTITSAAFAQGVWRPPINSSATVMIVDEDDPSKMVDAPDGTMVVAMIGDDKVGDAMVMDGRYSLQVMEGEEDATITFMIGEGMEAMPAMETAMFMAFQDPKKVDLSTGEAMMPVMDTATPLPPVKGEQGVRGRTGLQGPEGVQGPQGDPGGEGDRGRTGAQGPKGDMGDQGPKGQNGTNGTNGTNGADGADGADGSNGANGTNGADGNAGPKGDMGDMGGTGAVGPAGANGAAGADGGVLLAIIALIVAIVAVVAAAGIYVMGRRA